MPPADAPEVLYEDNHLLVLNKPAGLPTMGTPEGTATLLTLAKEYVKQKYQKPGNVYLGVVSRLDAPVTGVVLFARTSKAAARLTEQFRTQAVQKSYWALVEAGGNAASGSYTDHLLHDDRHRRVHVVESGRPGAKEARLAYRQIAQDVRFSLLEIELETGRKHQIRVQLAHHGQPIVGDRKYSSAVKFAAGIALHARRLVVAHPVRGEAMEFVAPLPKYWPAAIRALEPQS
jgi:23S rRNA pseudouridine1911/1915/1917 synthase